MKHLIMAYLLLKSAFKGTFTRLDISLAFALQLNDWDCPDFVKMIAGMPEEAQLPEAFGDLVFDVQTAVGDWMDGALRAMEEWLS